MSLHQYIRPSVGLCAALAIAFIFGAIPASSASTAAQPIQTTRDELQAAVAIPANGVAAAWIRGGQSMKAAIVRRDTTGEVELHSRLEHFYVAQEGRADVLLGAVVEGGHEISPGEVRGGRIVGGKLYRMNAGDVLWIPAHVAHQIVMTGGGSFTYLGFEAPVAPRDN